VIWRRKSIDDMRREIEYFLSTANEWVQAAFYGDPDIEELTSKLYERWESAGRRGEPLDYASYDEMKLIYEKAKRYSRLSVYEAMRLVMARQESSEEEEED